MLFSAYQLVTSDVSYTDNLAAFYKDADLIVMDAITLSGFFSTLPDEKIEGLLAGTHMSKRQIGQVITDSNAKVVICFSIGILYFHM